MRWFTWYIDQHYLKVGKCCHDGDRQGKQLYHPAFLNNWMSENIQNILQNYWHHVINGKVKMELSTREQSIESKESSCWMTHCCFWFCIEKMLFRECPSLLGLQNTLTACLQRGKTRPMNIREMTPNNLMPRLQ